MKRISRHSLSALFALTVFLGGCGSRGTARPHVILVTSDALRFDHLSLNGYPRATSPTIDGFAQNAWRFDQAVTVIPKTEPSLATMFTGRHPEQHGVRVNFAAIPKKLPVLAERLKALGYRTAAFVGNPVLRPGMGFSRGFDDFQLLPDDPVKQTNRAFLQWASRSWDQPTFVWIHYMDPHGPYTPPAADENLFIHDAWAQSNERVALISANTPTANPNKLLGAVPPYQRQGDEDRVAVYVARYDAEIHYMDAAFGEVLAYLKAHGLYDDSVVIFTADHGESLGENNYYFEHGWFACEPTLHIPLIIKLPGQKQGRVVAEQVSNLDFLPTVLQLVHAPAEAGLAGIDVLAPIPQRLPLLVENSDAYPDKFYGLRTPRWKYLVHQGDKAERLYDLVADPLETRNLADRETDRVSKLRTECQQALQKLRGDAPVAPHEGEADDPETLERLRSLGYNR